MKNSHYSLGAAAIATLFIIIAGCGESSAEAKMRRCKVDAQDTYDKAARAAGMATDKGSIANKIALAAADQAQAYTLSECLKRN